MDCDLAKKGVISYSSVGCDVAKLGVGYLICCDVALQGVA